MPLDTFAVQPPAPPAPSPAEVSVGTLIGRSFSVWWNNMFRFAGFTLVLFIPIALVVLALLGASLFTALAGGSQAAFAEMAGKMVLLMAVVLPLAMIAAVVQMGGLTYGGVQHLARRPVRFGGMLSAGFGRVLPLIGLGLLLFVAFLAASMVAGLFGAILGKFFTVLLYVAFVVAAVVVFCGLAAAVPAIVAERVGPIDGIKRSWELTRGHRGAIFLTMLVLVIAQVAIDLVAGLLGGALSGISRVAVVGIVFTFAVELLAMSLTTVMPAVAYHDLRTLKEGASTDDLAKVFE